MVCNNLPVYLCYNVENVYLAGILPGSQEPPQYYLNHILHPLVNDLLRSWSPGLQMTCTTLHARGCVVQCALIPLICDLLVAWKTAGFAGLGSHKGRFCSFYKLDTKDIENVNPSSRRRQTWQEYLAMARMWRDAPTEGV